MIDSYLLLVFVIVIITFLFILGVKIAFYFKNREIKKIIQKYESELSLAKQELEKVKTTLSEDLYKHIKRTEEMYKKLLEEKDEQIKTLLEENDMLKSWREELEIRLAELKGASKGNYDFIIYRLLEHNQKLNKALKQNWEKIENDLVNELNVTIEKIKKLFKEAEDLHKDSLEIISFYEANLPNDIKKQIFGMNSSSSKQIDNLSEEISNKSNLPKLT